MKTNGEQMFGLHFKCYVINNRTLTGVYCESNPSFSIFFYADISQTSRFTDTTKSQLKLDLLLPELLQHTVGVEHGSVLHLFDVGTRFRSLGEKKIYQKLKTLVLKDTYIQYMYPHTVQIYCKYKLKRHSVLKLSTILKL